MRKETTAANRRAASLPHRMGVLVLCLARLTFLHVAGSKTLNGWPETT